MRAFRFRFIAAFLLVVMAAEWPLAAFANPPSAGGGQVGAPPPFDARESVGNILLGGLVGGVLGLSTLSFYKKPQDNIRNITIGAGTGMIIAALALTFNIAANPRAIAENDLPKTQLIPVADQDHAGLLLVKRF